MKVKVALIEDDDMNRVIGTYMTLLSPASPFPPPFRVSLIIPVRR